MPYRGRVKNGVVVLDPPASLPEGSQVSVEPLAPADLVQSLKDGLRRFSGTVEGLPEDLAEHHDHYLHGKPRP
ncbi:MAG: hypothetical protein NTW86_02835 [Candidatus Sumerlaeota bacterium]|nr:hypothetical protein [Candidatus Sumerlaeota bacterium]